MDRPPRQALYGPREQKDGDDYGNDAKERPQDRASRLGRDLHSPPGKQRNGYHHKDDASNGVLADAGQKEGIVHLGSFANLWRSASAKNVAAWHLR